MISFTYHNIEMYSIECELKGLGYDVKNIVIETNRYTGKSKYVFNCD